MARYRELRKEFPPFGVLYIAASLENAGHSVKLFKLTPSQLVFNFEAFDAVGFSISASATFNMFMECRLKSSFSPKALLMVGGVHANLLPEQTLLDLKPHVVAVGESETTVLDILAAWPSADFSRIPGVCYISDGKPKRTPPRILSRDISSFPLPARHLMDESDLIMNDRLSDTPIRMTHIVPGRGCPFPCRYCASAQTKTQLRTGANIRFELEHLISKYAIKGFAIVGNDFILSRDNVFDICRSIAELELSWATLTRVDRVNPTTLEAMRAAGCYEVEYGIESGSQRMLEAMDKRATISQSSTALKASSAAAIKNKVFLVHGYPGENMESTEETMRFLDENHSYIHRVSLFRWVPLPGTYAYNHASEYKIRGTHTDRDWDHDWGKFHIHHNHHHWWGSLSDFKDLTNSYDRLKNHIESIWPSRFAAEVLPEDKWESQSLRFVRTQADAKIQK